MDLIVAKITSDFTQQTADSFNDTIDKALQSRQKVLPVIVNSYGGSVYALNTMICKINYAKEKGMRIVTLLNGIAMSCGAVLFSMGDDRYMSELSTVLVHGVSSWAWGNVNTMKSEVEHSEELQKKAFEILNKNCGKQPGFFEDLVKEKAGELYMMADKALEYGIATEIKIPSPEELSQIALKEARSPYNNFKMFLDLSKIAPAAKNITLPEEVKTLDLIALMAKLPPEEKKPIEALQAQLSTASNEVTTLKNKYLSLKLQFLIPLKNTKRNWQKWKRIPIKRFWILF